MTLHDLRNLWTEMQAGIYIHIPFCRSRCSYCDFATGMYESNIAERYVRALTREISNWKEVKSPANDHPTRAARVGAPVVDTVYFGGGTPSLLSPGQIERTLEAIHHRFEVLDGAELTIEINPASVPGREPQVSEEPELSRDKLREFRSLGINRASFGAQTFDNRELKLLGRTHDSRDIGETFRGLRGAGFANINFDLIAGLPGQTLSGWRQNLAEALKLRPEHLSLYLLDVHEGTPLADQIARGMRPKPDDDLAAEMYRVMIEEVCAAGYEHYEISNFCLPGFESRHNTKYWTGTPYYGFGCSAHSYDGARRRWANEPDVAKYSALIEMEQSPIVERTELSEEDSKSEAIFLGLRLMRGVDLQSYRTRFGKDLRDEHNGELDRLREAGLIEINEELLRLTTRGALLSNEVFAALA